MIDKAYIYVIICLSLIIAGCNSSQNHKEILPELMKAEEVMFDHPDSALYVLENMKKPSSRKNKENHALWCLLVMQAKYKMAMETPSDSLVKIAYDYYKPTNNARRRAMSALYMGNINYELGNIEDAMEYFLEAKTEVERIEDSKTGFLIMSSLGKLYLYRNLDKYALEACKAAYNYALEDSNKRYQMVALKLLARCYCISQELVKAIEFYQTSSDIAKELKLIDSYYNIQEEIALVYKNNGEYEKSLSILKTFPSEYQNLNLSLIGKDYYHLGKLDSAFLFLNKALCTDNIYTKLSIYEYLYALCDKPKYSQYLKNYCDSLLHFNDSIIKLDKGKEIIAYKEKYDNERLLSDKQKLELEKANVIYWWLFTIVIVLLLVILLIYIYIGVSELQFLRKKRNSLV